MKILIAYDGSEPSKAAIEDLSRAGLPGEAQAEVLCVADVYPHLPPELYAHLDDTRTKAAPAIARAREIAAAAMEAARLESTHAAKVLRVMFPGWQIESHTCGDVSYAGIVRRAEAWPADLIVIGAHGRSAAERLVFGSVAQKVLAHAPCSVRIGRARPTARGPNSPPRILIGMDNSSGAEAAVDAVRARRWPKDTEAIVAMALDAQSYGAMAIATRDSVIRGDIDERSWITGPVALVQQELEAVGLRVTTVIEEMNPRKLLLREAKQHAVDCIVVGARGLSALQRFVIGSVSSSIAARAECSVEVVRRPIV